MQPHDEYLEAQVMTAHPYQLHLMVIDGALRFAKQAEQALEQQDFETSHFALNNSRNFVTELLAGLDPTHTPEVVENLKSLFVYAYQLLVRADIDHNAEHVRSAIRVLELHRETWMEIVQHLGDEPLPTSTSESTSRDWTT